MSTKVEEEALIRRIKSDYANRVEVGNQEEYAKLLRKELDWNSISQSTVSRRMKKLGYTTRNGFIEPKGLDDGDAYRAELELFLLEESNGFCRLADCFIFLAMSNDYSYMARKNLKGLFADEILSVFNDDEGNLLIVTCGIEATEIVSGYFTEVGIK